MSTWKELEAELAACERDIILVRNRADKKALENQERERKIAERVKERQDTHAQKIKEATEEYEEQLENVRNFAAEEIAVEVEAQKMSEDRTQVALFRAEEAEAEAIQLQQRIQAMHALLSAKVAESERTTQEIKDRADRDVGILHDQTNEDVRNAALYASEVRESCLQMMEEHRNIALRCKAGIVEGTASKSIEPEWMRPVNCLALGNLENDWPDSPMTKNALPKPIDLDRPREMDKTMEKLATQMPPALTN